MARKKEKVEEKGPLCHCGHRKSKHSKKESMFDAMMGETDEEEQLPCMVEGCKCLRFIEMDEEDVEFLKTLP